MKVEMIDFPLHVEQNLMFALQPFSDKADSMDRKAWIFKFVRDDGWTLFISVGCVEQTIALFIKRKQVKVIAFELDGDPTPHFISHYNLPKYEHDIIAGQQIFAGVASMVRALFETVGRRA